LQPIVEQTGIARTTIRTTLLAEGVPQRPSCHPQLSMSWQSVAALYESGLTMGETTKRLKINPNDESVRHLEVRDQRGVTPGKCHQMQPEALDTSPAVLVGRSPRELDRVGVAGLRPGTATWSGHRVAYLRLARPPGVDADDPDQLEQGQVASVHGSIGTAPVAHPQAQIRGSG
jgi:hypothetical protein